MARIQGPAATQRRRRAPVDHENDGLQCAGITAADQRPRPEHLRFSWCRNVSPSLSSHSESLRSNDSWPKVHSDPGIGKVGQRSGQDAPGRCCDVCACRQARRTSRVAMGCFLPTEELRLTYVAQMPNTSREHRVVLHGSSLSTPVGAALLTTNYCMLPVRTCRDMPPQQVVLQHWKPGPGAGSVLPGSCPRWTPTHARMACATRNWPRLPAPSQGAPGGRIGLDGLFNSFGAHICRQLAWVFEA